nr:glutamate receptor ionotropic, kainate 5-like [Halyomorpha halys]
MPDCLVIVMSDSNDLKVPKDIIQMRFSPSSDELPAFLKEAYELKCDGYLVDQESAGYFFISLKIARLHANERLVPKIAIIPNKIGEFSEALFRDKETAFIPDLTIIQIDNSTTEERFMVVTNDFQGTNRKLKGDFIGIWPDDKIVFFPDKMADLKGKELYSSVVHYPPYVLAQDPVEGVECRPQLEFCRLHNCSLKIRTSEYLWGDIFPNGSGNGIFGEVFLDQSDFGVGGIYTWLEEFQYLDYSTPYGIGRINVLVPKPTKVDEWKTVFMPFSPTLWLLLVFSILVAATLMHCANIAAGKISDELILGGEFTTWVGIFFRAIGMSLLQPPPSILSASPLRRFFTIFEVLFLMFTTIYAGAIASVLTIPKYNPAIDSALQLYESGLRWVALHEVWILSLVESTEPYIKTLVGRFETQDEETLVRYTKEGVYAIGIELMETGQMIEASYLSVETVANHHIMKNDLSWSHVIMLHRKGSPYLEEMNRVIGRCRAAGLFLLWATNITANHLSSRFQIVMQISKGSSKVEIDEPIKLKLLHVRGAFMLFIAGMSLSSLVLMVEIIKFKIFNTKSRKLI